MPEQEAVAGRGGAGGQAGGVGGSEQVGGVGGNDRKGVLDDRGGGVGRGSVGAGPFVPQQPAACTRCRGPPRTGSTESPRPPAGRLPVWLLGSSGYSAQLAARLGLPFASEHSIVRPASRLKQRHHEPKAAVAVPGRRSAQADLP